MQPKPPNCGPIQKSIGGVAGFWKKTRGAGKMLLSPYFLKTGFINTMSVVTSDIRGAWKSVQFEKLLRGYFF